MGVLYPQGLQPESAIFFQHENIDKIIFEGYRDEEESRYSNALNHTFEYYYNS